MSTSITWDGVGTDRGRIFEDHWLDIEPIYKKAGWTVRHENPGYNETGPAMFTFKKRWDGKIR